MITAVDSSVLLDLFIPDPVFGPASRDAIIRCVREGDLIASEVAWAETIATFGEVAAGERALAELGVSFSATAAAAASTAGATWRAYRRGGGPRDRIVADFLIGAHAAAQADRLLTRDRGFYRSYFSRLTIVDPTEP